MISRGRRWPGAAAAEWVRVCSDGMAPGHPRRARLADYRCPAGGAESGTLRQRLFTTCAAWA